MKRVKILIISCRPRFHECFLQLSASTQCQVLHAVDYEDAALKLLCFEIDLMVIDASVALFDPAKTKGAVHDLFLQIPFILTYGPLDKKLGMSLIRVAGQMANQRHKEPAGLQAAGRAAGTRTVTHKHGPEVYRSPKAAAGVPEQKTCAGRHIISRPLGNISKGMIWGVLFSIPLWLLIGVLVSFLVRSAAAP